MDSINSLDLVGKVTKKKLEKQGLVAVKDIKDLSREQLEAIAKLDKGNGIGLPQILGFQEQAKAAILGGPPEKMDNRKAKNPWKAQYGKDWEEKHDQLSLMSSYCSIKTLVENMISECKIMLKGTSHKHDWLSYHNVLSLLTANKTIAWIITNNGSCLSLVCALTTRG